MKELMTTTGYGFREWLRSYTDARGPIGDLAWDVAGDDTWPVGGDYQSYVDYLMEVGAVPDALEAFREAWMLYCGEVPPEVHENF